MSVEVAFGIFFGVIGLILLYLFLFKTGIKVEDSEENENTIPVICPYCENPITEDDKVPYVWIEGPVFGSLYGCPHCGKVLGIHNE